MFKRGQPYKIVESIGEGLNASVYKVTKTQPDLKTDHIFALKVLKHTSDLKVFKLEFETLLRANGKHLVRYCGWERYKSRPALLLEYIDGVTLYEIFQSYQLSLEEVSWIYQETVKGLQELEESNLVHGDLSLKNIMLQKNGQLKLIDFGLSHWSTQKIELTPEFADSELLNGAVPTYKTDLVSAQKIIKKLSIGFDAKKVLLKNSFSTAPSPPASLVEKVMNLKEEPAQTKSFGPSPVKADPKKLSFNLAAWLLTPLLFLTPASASNNLNKEILYQIRSKNWIEVTNDRGQSCFTPCSLNMEQGALETVRWRSKNQKGKLKVYTGLTNVISIDL